MYLDRTFGLRLSLSEITSLFGLSRYLDQTFAQQIGSAKVKSKSEVTQCKKYHWITHKLELSLRRFFDRMNQ